MTLVIAHRGSSTEEVENSLAAFRRAVREGADGIELDVHATADGEIIVRHDAMLAGNPVATLPLRDVRIHTLENGEAIPTLEEALATIGPATTAFIEVKALTTAAERRLVEIIGSAPAPARCHIHSFDHRIIRRLGAGLPASTLGVLSTSYLIHPLAQLADAGAGELWQEQSLIDRQLLAAVHDAGGRLYAWTVDDVTRIKTLATMGVDGVCTNRPVVARAALS